MENPIDILWLLLCAGLVFLMQAGFLGVETGYTRSKNNINIALKNIVDFAVSTLAFLLVGYGIMFGDLLMSPQGYLATPFTAAFFIFQAMFCGTAVTIISGAIAERTKFSSYIYLTLFISLLVYPTVGRWAWRGAALGDTVGWLQQLGFVDLAGGTVVHSVGGWAALAILLIIGPRHGRFSDAGSPHHFQGANIPFAGLGLLLLFVGWLGFNGGSTLTFNEQTLRVIINTLVAGSGGLVAAALFSFWRSGQATVSSIINGTLAGLVAITAGAHGVDPLTAVFFGAVGGLIMIMVTQLLEQQKIDDAIAAVPIHLGAGIWGTIAVGLFGDPLLLDTGLSRMAQTGVQLLGVATTAVWTFGLTYIAFKLFNHFWPLRISLAAEQQGLNISEHNASTDLVNLFHTMQQQAQTNDLNLRAPVDPFTDVGQIATRYNHVLNSLQEAERSLSVVVNNSPIILFAIDKNGIFTLSEGKGLEKLGRQPKEVVGRSIFDVYRNQPKILESIQAAMTGESIKAEVILDNLAYDALYEPVWHEEQIVGVVGIAHDITERVEMEEALVQAHDRAQAANQFKSDLLAKVSHELRTPLGVIMAYGEMLQHGIYGKLTAEQEDKSELIVKNAEHLTNMVNDLLDQSQLEAGSLQLHPEKFILKELLDDVQIQMMILAEQKELELIHTHHPNLPETIAADKVRLRQILFNLLGNAIKFTDTGQVHLSVFLPAPDRLAFAVQDSGPGIGEADRSSIFEPFKQVKNDLTAGKKGSGLGLAITHNLVQLMGGELTVNSEVGVGSTFTAILPIEDREP